MGCARLVVYLTPQVAIKSSLYTLSSQYEIPGRSYDTFIPDVHNSDHLQLYVNPHDLTSESSVPACFRQRPIPAFFDPSTLSDFDSFPWDPPSDLPSPLILGTQDFFANPFPEFTLPSHKDSSLSQLLPIEDVLPIEEESSGNSSSPLAERFVPGPISIEPSEGLQQDAQDKGATTGFEFDDPGQRVPTHKVTARSPPTASPDHTSCQVCNKQFSRKHELQYVPQSS